MADIIGAQLPEENADYKSVLQGAGPDKVVTVFNPLTADFRVQYARQLVQPPTLSPGAQLAKDKAGLDLSKEQGVQGHAVQYHVLKAGKSENLPGDIAQIAVRQLRNHILTSRPGKGNVKRTADPVAQMEVEKEIVLNITDNTTFFNQSQEPTSDPPPGEGRSYQPSTKVTSGA